MSTAARGRLRAESLMTSTCTIRGRSSGSSMDPDTGGIVPTPGAIVYAGKCRVRPGALQASSTAQAGGAEVFRFGYLVSIPFGATDVPVGAQVTIDASADPTLVGVTVTVVKADRGDHITARRLYCEEVA